MNITDEEYEEDPYCYELRPLKRRMTDPRTDFISTEGGEEE